MWGGSGILLHSEIEERTDISLTTHPYLGAGKTWGRRPLAGQLGNVGDPCGFGPAWSYFLPGSGGGATLGSGEMEVAAAKGPEVLQRDARKGPLEPLLLLASSQVKDPRQMGPPSLLAMRVRSEA